ncbi:MAG: hypothetical protein GY696_16360, partial [Gammaproteobacteria bacterium]|nr:hypothetical protein [Gammaproteobacteria bacterium]
MKMTVMYAMYRARPPFMSVLELRAVQRELENLPWTPYLINRRQGSASVWGKREQQATANKLARSKMWTQVGTGPVTHPHQHRRGDVPPPPELARTYMGFQPLPGADVQPRAAQEQEEELPEDPEPEEPRRAEGPPQEEKTQLPQPQISTLGCPTGLVFTHKVKSTIPVSI